MMHSDLLLALLRVLPFCAVMVVVAIRIRQGAFTTSELDLRLPPRWSVALAWCAGFLVYMLAVEWLLYRAELLELGAFHHQGLPAALRIIGMILLAPVAEELLFRGILLNVLERRLGGLWKAVLLQAVVFTLLHNFTWRGDAMGGFYAAQSFLDAVLYALARSSSRSMLTPMAMHVTGNLVAVLEMLD